jgi:hypothetical protein
MRTPIGDPPARPPLNPAEGPPDMDLPGADGPVPMHDPDADMPQRLGERIDDKAGGIASGEPDLLPDVDMPDASM